MLASAFITKLRVRLADSDDTSFSDAEILEYINEGSDDLAYVGCFQHKQTVAFSSASTANLASALTYKFLAVPLVDYDGEPLQFAPVTEQVNFTSVDAGTPTAWTVWGDTLYVDYSFTGNLNVWYTYKPTVLSATNETIALNEKWIPALLAYCEYRCKAQDGDGDAIAIAEEYKALKATAQVVNGAMMVMGGVA